MIKTEDVWYKELNSKPQVYTIWSFGSRDTRLGSEDGTISEVVEKLRLGRDVKIWKLLMLGYSNAKCGEIYGLDESTIRKDIREKLQTQFIPIQNSYYKDKKTIEQIKEFNHLDEITARGIVLKEKDDLV